MPPFGRSLTFVFSAAGFIATSTFGRSPGVRMSWSAKWIWKPDTPGSEPAGARISAGKSGSVERSLPSTAVSLVKRAPVSCMPSPESPAKRMITWLMRSTVFAITVLRYSAAAGRGGFGLVYGSAVGWHIEGDYFESCNCEAICPCRTVGAFPAAAPPTASASASSRGSSARARPTASTCRGLAAAFTIRYDDDEPGSPWSFVVYVDERGTEEQRDALAEILTGRLGGDGAAAPVGAQAERPDRPSGRRGSTSATPTATTSCASARRSSSRRRGRSRPTSASAAASPATTSPAPSTTPTGSRSPTTRSSGSSRATARSSSDVRLLRMMPTHVCLSFDFDALSVWLAYDRVTPAMLHRGEYGARVGVPRILRPARRARDQGDLLRPRPHGRVVPGRGRVDPRRRARDRPPLLRAHRPERPVPRGGARRHGARAGACSSGSA